MLASDVAAEERPATSSAEPVVNDFSIQVATVNGSGSQTANLVLLRAIFQMGVPVSAKNMFPSNIAGLRPGSRSGPTRADISVGRSKLKSSWP